MRFSKDVRGQLEKLMSIDSFGGRDVSSAAVSLREGEDGRRSGAGSRSFDHDRKAKRRKQTHDMAAAGEASSSMLAWWPRCLALGVAYVLAHCWMQLMDGRRIASSAWSDAPETAYPIYPPVL